MTTTEEICQTCGCIVGAGCPQSTPEECARYVMGHPGEYSPEEIAEAAAVLAAE